MNQQLEDALNWKRRKVAQLISEYDAGHLTKQELETLSKSLLIIDDIAAACVTQDEIHEAQLVLNVLYELVSSKL